MGILALALALRTGVAVLFADFNPTSANIWEYGSLARNYLDHGAIVGTLPEPGGEFIYPTAFMPPLHIFTWIGIFKVLGVTTEALVAMTTFNVVAGVACVYLTAGIAKALFDSKVVSLGAALVMAIHPVWVFSVSTYHSVNQYAALLLLLVYLSLRQSKPGLKFAVVAGTLLGLAALERTEYLVLGGAVVAAHFLMHRRWRVLGVTLITAALVLAPWTIRNELVLDRFVPVANTTGYNLFKGFNPEANGSGDWVDTHDIRTKLLGKELDALPRDTAYDNASDDVMKDAAIEYIKDHPVRSFVELPVRKVFLFWAFDIYDPLTYSLLYQLALWPPTVLAILGLILCWRRGLFRQPGHRIVLLFFLAQTAVMCAYAVHARYRMSVEPMLFAYAAYGALEMLRMFRSRRQESSHGRQAATPVTGT